MPAPSSRKSCNGPNRGGPQTAPTVTVNQAAGQVDPTNIDPIHFTAIFNEPVNALAANGNGVTLDGTADRTAATIVVTPTNSTHYDIAVSGLGDGTITAELAPTATTDLAGNTNLASTGTDNSVTYDTLAPSVTVNQKVGQVDPANTLPILYTVTFSKPVTGFDETDLTRTGTSTGGTVNVTGSGADYEIAVTGTPTNGTLTFTVGATKAIDLAGNNNTASTSTDNSVTYDTVAPATLDNSASITNAWKNTTQTVTLIPSDSGSGVAATYYTTNGTDPTTSSFTGTSVVLSADGTYTIKYFSVDSAGNTEGVKTAGTQIRIDKTAPSTTDNAPAGWTNAASVPVTLTPAETGSGLAHTYYTTDGSDPTTSSSRSDGTLVNITAAGTTTIKYSSVDTAGNVEAVKTATVRIDRTNPTPDITFPAANGTYKIGNNGNGSWNKGSAATSCGADQMCGPATDATSGVASVQISLKGPNGKWWDGTYTTVGGTANFTSTTEIFQTVPYSSGVWSIAWSKENFNGTGEYTLAVKVTDAAGNSATTTPRDFMTTS